MPSKTEGVRALDDLYEDLDQEQLAPLWTQVEELMPGQRAILPKGQVRFRAVCLSYRPAGSWRSRKRDACCTVLW